ncbi:MAG: alpha/beta hydrolase [Leptolyngbyaceae cyanobacterium]
MLKLVSGLLSLIAIAYIAFCAALWLGQARLIFFPQPAPTATPAMVGLNYEDVWIAVGDDRVHGWWIPAERGDAKTVLSLHGNASNVEGGLRQVLPLLNAGLSALVIDYRGYGFSRGPLPNEAQVYEDAVAAWQYLTTTRGIAAADIVVFGHSIGGAIAIDLATHYPTAAGLIIQSTFTSMADMMDQVGYSRIVPKWLLNQRFASLDKIVRLTLPIFFIHGDADATVPAWMSQRLYDAKPGDKQIWLVPRADHNDVRDIAGEEYGLQLAAWLRSLHNVESPLVN